MAKGSGASAKIKSVLKKMQSFKLGRASVSVSNSDSGKDLHTVYVGKSRRRYLISSDVMENPLFRELVEDDASIGCEVVLFEHLLWMLENADPQHDSLGDLVQFYAC